MVSSGGSSSGRGLGVDRFYNPPAVRRQLELQRQQQQQDAALRRPVKSKVRPITPPVAEQIAINEQLVENRAESDDSSKLSVSSTSSSASTSPPPSPPLRSTPPVANLERFLYSTTPFVPVRYSQKMIGRGWRKYDNAESCSFFILGDLWESFKEWSAYGAGVPLVLNGDDCVVQYYVPYLSGIQIYTGPSRTSWKSRQPGDECNSGMHQDVSSDVGSENEAEWTVRKTSDNCFATSHKEHHCSFVGENGTCNSATLPVFEYLEHDPPYGREPLADKITLLANKFPRLKSYRSCDLLPFSWISVAWYPIYRIPTGPTLRDLDACFLTFHFLSTSPINSINGHSQLNGTFDVRNVDISTQMSAKLPLPVFGLASYKFQGSIWINNGIYEHQLASSLLQAAEDWLQRLKVDQPDFRFFLSHYNKNVC